MNGTLIPHTPIAVDYWRVRDCPQAKVFFLTHLHADHIMGLTPSWSQRIYCTSLTKKLLIQKLQIKERLIHDLATNDSHIIWLDEGKKESMTVTVLDAHHCPGSAMFLFQGYFGTILHTGDFRYTEKMFIDAPVNLTRSVDVLYLDNTYSSPECEFPTRRQAMKEIFSILDNHPDHQILVGMRSLGKEDLLVAMAFHVQTWVTVNAAQYEILKLMDMPNVFTTDKSLGRIHLVPMHQMNTHTFNSWNAKHPTIGIMPTSLYIGSNNPYQFTKGIFVIPYSDHSSYTELHHFVEKVQPKKIIPIVSAKSRGPLGKDISERANMAAFRKYLNPKPIVTFTVPDTVESYMKRYNYDVNFCGKPKRKCSVLPRIKRKRSSVPLGVVYDENGLSDSEGSDIISNCSSDLGHTTSKRRLTDLKQQCNGFPNLDNQSYSRLTPSKSEEASSVEESVSTNIGSPAYNFGKDQGFDSSDDIFEDFDLAQQRTTFQINISPCVGDPNTRDVHKVSKTPEWKLIPITLPENKRYPVWSTIGDPLWYFTNILTQNRNSGANVDALGIYADCHSDISHNENLHEVDPAEVHISSNYSENSTDLSKNQISEGDHVKKQCSVKISKNNYKSVTDEIIPLYANRTPMSSRSTPCPSDMDDFLTNSQSEVRYPCKSTQVIDDAPEELSIKDPPNRDEADVSIQNDSITNSNTASDTSSFKTTPELCTKLPLSVRQETVAELDEHKQLTSFDNPNSLMRVDDSETSFKEEKLYVPSKITIKKVQPKAHTKKHSKFPNKAGITEITLSKAMGANFNKSNNSGDVNTGNLPQEPVQCSSSYRTCNQEKVDKAQGSKSPPNTWLCTGTTGKTPSSLCRDYGETPVGETPVRDERHYDGDDILVLDSSLKNNRRPLYTSFRNFFPWDERKSNSEKNYSNPGVKKIKSSTKTKESLCGGPTIFSTRRGKATAKRLLSGRRPVFPSKAVKRPSHAKLRHQTIRRQNRFQFGCRNVRVKSLSSAGSKRISPNEPSEMPGDSIVSLRATSFLVDSESQQPYVGQTRPNSGTENINTLLSNFCENSSLSIMKTPDYIVDSGLPDRSKSECNRGKDKPYSIMDCELSKESVYIHRVFKDSNETKDEVQPSTHIFNRNKDKKPSNLNREKKSKSNNPMASNTSCCLTKHDVTGIKEHKRPTKTNTMILNMIKGNTSYKNNISYKSNEQIKDSVEAGQEKNKHKMHLADSSNSKGSQFSERQKGNDKDLRKTCFSKVLNLEKNNEQLKSSKDITKKLPNGTESAESNESQKHNTPGKNSKNFKGTCSDAHDAVLSATYQATSDSVDPCDSSNKSVDSERQSGIFVRDNQQSRFTNQSIYVQKKITSFCQPSNCPKQSTTSVSKMPEGLNKSHCSESPIPLGNSSEQLKCVEKLTNIPPNQSGIYHNSPSSIEATSEKEISSPKSDMTSEQSIDSINLSGSLKTSSPNPLVCSTYPQIGSTDSAEKDEIRCANKCESQSPIGRDPKLTDSNESNTIQNLHTLKQKNITTSDHHDFLSIVEDMEYTSLKDQGDRNIIQETEMDYIRENNDLMPLKGTPIDVVKWNSTEEKNDKGKHSVSKSTTKSFGGALSPLHNSDHIDELYPVKKVMPDGKNQMGDVISFPSNVKNIEEDTHISNSENTSVNKKNIKQLAIPEAGRRNEETKGESQTVYSVDGSIKRMLEKTSTVDCIECIYNSDVPVVDADSNSVEDSIQNYHKSDNKGTENISGQDSFKMANNENGELNNQSVIKVFDSLGNLVATFPQSEEGIVLSQDETFHIVQEVSNGIAPLEFVALENENNAKSDSSTLVQEFSSSPEGNISEFLVLNDSCPENLGTFTETGKAGEAEKCLTVKMNQEENVDGVDTVHQFIPSCEDQNLEKDSSQIVSPEEQIVIVFDDSEGTPIPASILIDSGLVVQGTDSITKGADPTSNTDILNEDSAIQNQMTQGSHENTIKQNTVQANIVIPNGQYRDDVFSGIGDSNYTDINNSTTQIFAGKNKQGTAGNCGGTSGNSSSIFNVKPKKKRGWPKGKPRKPKNVNNTNLPRSSLSLVIKLAKKPKNLNLDMISERTLNQSLNLEMKDGRMAFKAAKNSHKESPFAENRPIHDILSEIYPKDFVQTDHGADDKEETISSSLGESEKLIDNGTAECDSTEINFCEERRDHPKDKQNTNNHVERIDNTNEYSIQNGMEIGQNKVYDLSLDSKEAGLHHVASNLPQPQFRREPQNINPLELDPNCFAIVENGRPKLQSSISDCQKEENTKGLCNQARHEQEIQSNENYSDYESDRMVREQDILQQAVSGLSYEILSAGREGKIECSKLVLSQESSSFDRVKGFQCQNSASGKEKVESEHIDETDNQGVKSSVHHGMTDKEFHALIPCDKEIDCITSAFSQKKNNTDFNISFNSQDKGSTKCNLKAFCARIDKFEGKDDFSETECRITMNDTVASDIKNSDMITEASLSDNGYENNTECDNPSFDKENEKNECSAKIHHMEIDHSVFVSMQTSPKENINVDCSVSLSCEKNINTECNILDLTKENNNDDCSSPITRKEITNTDCNISDFCEEKSTAECLTSEFTEGNRVTDCSIPVINNEESITDCNITVFCVENLDTKCNISEFAKEDRNVNCGVPVSCKENHKSKCCTPGSCAETSNTEHILSELTEEKSLNDDGSPHVASKENYSPENTIPVNDKREGTAKFCNEDSIKQNGISEFKRSASNKKEDCIGGTVQTPDQEKEIDDYVALPLNRKEEVAMGKKSLLRKENREKDCKTLVSNIAHLSKDTDKEMAIQSGRTSSIDIDEKNVVQYCNGELESKTSDESLPLSDPPLNISLSKHIHVIKGNCHGNSMKPNVKYSTRKNFKIVKKQGFKNGNQYSFSSKIKTSKSNTKRFLIKPRNASIKKVKLCQIARKTEQKDSLFPNSKVKNKNDQEPQDAKSIPKKSEKVLTGESCSESCNNNMSNAKGVSLSDANNIILSDIEKKVTSNSSVELLPNVTRLHNSICHNGTHNKVVMEDFPSIESPRKETTACNLPDNRGSKTSQHIQNEEDLQMEITAEERPNASENAVIDSSVSSIKRQEPTEAHVNKECLTQKDVSLHSTSKSRSDENKGNEDFDKSNTQMEKKDTQIHNNSRSSTCMDKEFFWEEDELSGDQEIKIPPRYVSEKDDGVEDEGIIIYEIHENTDNISENNQEGNDVFRGKLSKVSNEKFEVLKNSCHRQTLTDKDSADEIEEIQELLPGNMVSRMDNLSQIDEINPFNTDPHKNIRILSETNSKSESAYSNFTEGHVDKTKEKSLSESQTNEDEDIDIEIVEVVESPQAKNSPLLQGTSIIRSWNSEHDFDRQSLFCRRQAVSFHTEELVSGLKEKQQSGLNSSFYSENMERKSVSKGNPNRIKAKPIFRILKSTVEKIPKEKLKNERKTKESQSKELINIVLTDGKELKVTSASQGHI